MDPKEELKSKEIKEAVDVFRKGGVVIFPTDTVYGIGCRADMPQAVARIKNIKKTNQSFPILISSINQAHEVAQMDQKTTHIANTYWPGGLTIILNSKNNHGKIGVRMPDSQVVSTLIGALGVPIVGTSANLHGKPAVSKSEDLDPNIENLVDYIIHGECEKKIESTVLDATISPFKVLREGAVKIKWN